MRPLFHPRLINDPFDDPGLFVSFLFEKRAVLFDLGDLCALPAKEILKVTHIFITHTHMDHFIGFDRVLRLFLGRDKQLYLYGPKSLLRNVEAKLGGYEWNLVENFSYPFSLTVTEVHDDILLINQYNCRQRFRESAETRREKLGDVLYAEPSFSVSAVLLDHSIPCLGFTIKENFHVNIRKEAVSALGLEIGPWLARFKQALYHSQDPESEFEVIFGKGDAVKKKYILGELAERIALITPGQKITYISDVAYHQSNVEKIVEFAEDTDHLFIEAGFLEKDRDIAEKKFHLTAWQAGTIARKARAKQFSIFHFSPRYIGQDHLLKEEARAAFEAYI